jgi:acylphosphatase
MDRERLEARVHGKVQGVWFRDFTCKKARALGLCGEVRNVEDGTVQVVAEGGAPHLRELIRHLHIGPRAAKVQQVDVAWKPAEGKHVGFEII